MSLIGPTPEEATSALGERFKTLRRQLPGRPSREEFADRAGIPFSTYRRLEITGQASTENLLKALDVHGLVPDLLGMLDVRRPQSLDELKRTSMGALRGL